MCVPANGGHLLSCRRSGSKFFASWNSRAFPFHWLSHQDLWLILQRNLWHLVHVWPVIDDKYLLLSVSVLHQVWWDLMSTHLFHLKILVDYIVKSCPINSCSTLHLINDHVSLHADEIKYNMQCGWCAWCCWATKRMPFCVVSMPMLKLCTQFNTVQNYVVHLCPW